MKVLCLAKTVLFVRYVEHQ